MDATTSRTRRPPAVTIASFLVLASSGVTFIDLAARLHSQAHVIQYMGSAIIAILFAWAFLVGKGWVRWVFLAPVSIGVLTSPVYFQQASTFGAAYFCFQGLLQIGALVLLFLRKSNEWFRLHKQLG